VPAPAPTAPDPAAPEQPPFPAETQLGTAPVPARSLRVTVSPARRRVLVAIDCRLDADDCRGVVELRLRGRVIARRTIRVSAGDRRRVTLPVRRARWRTVTRNRRALRAVLRHQAS
jgi:hypothetical protein